MVFGRTHGLSDGENVDAAPTEIAEDLDQFVNRLANANHDAALGDRLGVPFLRTREQVEGALVAGTGTDRAVEARHGFSVVIQDLDAAIRNKSANFADGFGEDASAPNVIVVAIHAGDNGMLKTERSDSFRDTARLVPIDRLRAALGDGAKSAAACADVTEEHECGRAMVPALADVRALGGLADRVQSEAASKLLEIVKVVTDRSFGLEPVRLGNARRRSERDLDKLGRSRHACWNSNKRGAFGYQVSAISSQISVLTKRNSPTRHCLVRLWRKEMNESTK